MDKMGIVMDWFLPLNQTQVTTSRLYLFPYAGGNARLFSGWVQSFPSDVALFALQLPGRGEKIHHPLMVDMPTLIESLASEITRHNELPFSFFGHSLGARIAFQLAGKLEAMGQVPAHVFLSAARAPDLPRTQSGTYRLPTEAFIQKLRDIGGTPATLLDNRELMSLMLPMIRADFQLAETCGVLDPHPLSANASLFYGVLDFMDIEQQHYHWQQHFHQPITCQRFPGGHFYLHQHQDALIQQITGLLAASGNTSEG